MRNFVVFSSSKTIKTITTTYKKIDFSALSTSVRICLGYCIPFQLALSHVFRFPSHLHVSHSLLTIPTLFEFIFSAKKGKPKKKTKKTRVGRDAASAINGRPGIGPGRKSGSQTAARNRDFSRVFRSVSGIPPNPGRNTFCFLLSGQFSSLG